MPRNNQKGHGPNRLADATNASGPASVHHRATLPPGGRGAVRIIGGEWRGRKLHFPQSASIRPTPDRVRETVFNWLQLQTARSRCLDLFAGSGALGLEALSRGASETVFVERDQAAARHIDAALALFKCTRGRVELEDAFRYLARPGAPFDIVFLDPPFDSGWLAKACVALEQGGWLHDGSHIYLEDAAAHGAPVLPPTWTLLRCKRAGDVGYYLARRQAPS
jgi:16S rRNA (guanine966-N2)-methyltransferase